MNESPAVIEVSMANFDMDLNCRLDVPQDYQWDDQGQLACRLSYAITLYIIPK